MAIVASVFALMIIIGVPMAFVIGLAGTAHILVLDNLQYFDVLVQRMVAGVNSSSLLCIPFFILTGQLMNYGGITERIFQFVRETVGFVRGGLAYATVVVGMIMSAILGSSNAVASILCTSVQPELVKDGYDDDFATCLIAAAGTLGPIIPPGIGMVMMGVLTGVSVRSLFIAGIIPGIIIGLSYMVIAYIYTKKRGYKKTKEHFEFKAWLSSLWRALPSMMVPVVIIGGVIGGVFTPAEAGCVSVAIAVICGLAYGTLKVKQLPQIMMKAAITSSAIMLIIAFGNVLGWTLVMDKIPARISASILSQTTSPSVVLSMIVFCMLIIGFFIEGFSSYLIFAPVFAAIATSVGIDLVHYSMLFIIMINVGVITPPVGMVLFLCSNITKVPLSKLSKSIYPFVAAAIAAVLLMMFVPEIVLFLPRLLGN